MAGKGAYVMTQLAIRQKRQSYDQAKSYNNWFAMCTALIEMANALPAETRCKGALFGEFDGKPFRDYIDAVILPAMPDEILTKDVLDKQDQKNIKAFVAKFGWLIERVSNDYVHAFHKKGRQRGRL